MDIGRLVLGARIAILIHKTQSHLICSIHSLHLDSECPTLDSMRCLWCRMDFPHFLQVWIMEVM